ncbi:hypothetical protein FHX81_7698 [Saccharothrix saharensis]|uniref:Uncharacterized protein n=1 Tax=Saccharothrix saharensis TaxID=571190 RepID=A0A543JR41_9PSEU|nr:hypothetical protein [Saccharothrix saharensis]TQM85225.1 hypothetical protein FHX81_7698 [Saccharothrix saharensis]
MGLAACASSLRDHGRIRARDAGHAFRAARCATRVHPSPDVRIGPDPKVPPEAASGVIHRARPDLVAAVCRTHSTPAVPINRDDAFGTPARRTAYRHYGRPFTTGKFTRPEYPLPIPTRRW